MSLLEKLKRGWNAFTGRDPTELYSAPGPAAFGSSMRPDKTQRSRGHERSIIMSAITRMGIDVAAIKIEHVKLDDNGRYLEQIPSNLNNCLTLEANKDQTARSFIQDITMSMCDEGVVAVCPAYTTANAPFTNETFTADDILAMRVCKIVQWFPDHVTVEMYNDETGNKQQRTFMKSQVAIIENPLSQIMNEPNSTLQRLIRKLNLLDVIDEQSGAGKLDLIIQLPYVIKSEARRKEAEKRRKDIEVQLAGSKYGVAYTDGTERITQLNRPAENNLMKQIEYLTSMLYGQLGITQGVFDGTADEQTMLNYYNRTIEPMISAITDELKRKFLTKTARTQGQSIAFFRDPFKLVPTSQIADMADKFTRNEILSKNEVRAIIGYKPSDDPAADELRNANLNRDKNDPRPAMAAPTSDATANNSE